MKTNVPIDLTAEELSLIADFIDGKETKRRATRADIVALCQQFIGGMVEQSNRTLFHVKPVETQSASLPHPWNTPDPEDRAVLDGKSEGFIYGWNKVKHTKRGG